MDSFTSKSVILRKMEYGDADSIVTFFTQKSGRIKAFARKAKRSRKRFGTSLDIAAFVLADFTPPKRASSFHSLNSVSCLKNYANIRKDLASIMMANYMLELFYEMTPENESGADLFAFLENFLDLLDGGNLKMPSFHLFVIKFLRMIGLGPKAGECVICARKYDNKRWNFKIDKGGIICRQCEPRQAGADIDLSPETINLIRREGENQVNFVKRVLPSKKASVELSLVADRFIQFHLGKRLNSAKVLEEMDAKAFK